jgi:hypothetical protein
MVHLPNSAWRTALKYSNLIDRKRLRQATTDRSLAGSAC